jgi:hypothetical protein
MNTILITSEINGIVHFEFTPQGQTVNRAYYMWKYWNSYMKLCTEKDLNFGLMFGSSTSDDAPAHKALSSSFWPKNQFLKWNTHPNSLIWP